MTNNIALIAAMANNRVIGNQGQLPWRLPRDMQWFRKHTLGKPIIMGRKTCESLPKALPKRRNIVVSRQLDFSAEGFEIVASIEGAIKLASQNYSGEIMVIGGEMLYRQTLEQANRLYLTEVNDETNGDAFFPEYDAGQWKTVSSESCPADEKNPFALRFLMLQRLNA